MLSRKILLRITLNTALGLVLIIFWLKLVDLNSILNQLRQVNYIYIVPFIFFFAFSSVLRSIRLKLLLHEFKLPLKDLLPLTYLSQLLSFTIPLRLGELSKAVYLSTEYDLSFAKSVIWIFLDRFFDFWILLILVFSLLFFIPTSLPQSLNTSLELVIGLVSIAATLVLFMPKICQLVIDFVCKLLIFSSLQKLFTKISKFIIDATSLLEANLTKSLQIFTLTVLALLSDGLTWYVLFLALKSNIEFLQIFLGSMLSSLTYLIPAAPGYVGSAEAAGLAVFSLGLGIDKNLASAVTVLAHGLTLGCILVFGLASLYILKFDLSQVWKKFKK